jgi:glycosyltransferase involved in cell wall biosynthesis
VVAVIGRLEPQKGHRVLFDALPRVRAEIADLRVVVVGEGTLRPALERQVTRLGLETCVEFVGYQADIGPWLGAADVTVLPSFYEGLPLVAIESLAAGRPMVASAVDGVPEVVVDGETGLTVPPGEPGLLADALIRMLADQGLRERLGETGRRLVRERFTKERQLRSTAQLYCQTVGGMPLQSSPAGERAEPGSPAASAGNRSA